MTSKLETTAQDSTIEEHEVQSYGDTVHGYSAWCSCGHSARRGSLANLAAVDEWETTHLNWVRYIAR